MTAVLLFASFAVGFTHGLPAVALGWIFGLQLLRAGAAIAIFAAISMFLVRGWIGRWPSRLSTSGVEFDDLSKASDGLERGAALALQVTRELAHIREDS